jgi:N-acetylglucosamine-6-phosphate deacetylase
MSPASPPAFSAPTFFAIDAAAVFTPVERYRPGRVIVRNGVIQAVGLPSDVRIPEGASRMEASALTVTPGFVDSHVHGIGGADVMSASPDSLQIVSRALARHGTTSFLPTTVSSPADVLAVAVERISGSIRGMGGRFDGAKPLGIHLEGPFINRSKRGTHREDNVLSPDPHLFADWLRRGGGCIKLLTLAPEVDGAPGIVSQAIASGIAVGMGHSNATAEQASEAVGRGVCYAVHTFNAMRPFTHRDPGIVGVVLTDDRVFAEIIADGVHVAPEALHIFARAKGRDRILLVTDSTSATDMPDGAYVLGNERVNVVQGVCRDHEGQLAGSTLTQEIALKNFVRWTGMPLEDALFGLTLNPARALGLEGVGAIEPGARADLVLLDDDFNVACTFVDGKTVFERRSQQWIS